MSEDELFAKMKDIAREVKSTDPLNPTGPDEETDPRIVKLLNEAEQIMHELDPIVREKFRDDPAKLAEWDEITHMCDDPDEN